MKRLASFLIFLLAAMSCSAQWKSWNWQQLPLPAPYDDGYYLGIYFLPTNPLVGWVCGYKGAVLRTRDGGNSWTGVTIPNAPQLESIVFLNDNEGYCSGTNTQDPNSGGVYRSRDGGRTWEEITPILLINGQRTRASVWGCSFSSVNVGLVVGGGCGSLQQFYRTTDGGNSWKLFTSNYPNSGLSHPKIINENGLCYASSSGLMWQSLDGGLTWQVLCSTGPQYWQENMKVINNSFCAATAGTDCTGNTDPTGDIRFSRDRGASWTRFSTGAAMFGTYMLNDSTAWAAGFDRAIYRTSDYGKTWTPFRCGIKPGSNFDDLLFVNDTLGYIVGSGIYRTVKASTAPSIVVTGDTVFCEGAKVRLSIPGVYSEYRWSNGVLAPSIEVSTSGDYFVVVRKSFDCDLVSNTVRVKVLPAPKLGLKASKANNHLCSNDSVVLSIGSLFPYIRWSTGDSTKSIVVRTSGVYAVEVRDTNGCVARDSITVTGGENRIPKINQGAATRFCEGDSLQLSAESGFGSYQWSNGSKAQSIYVGESGRYSVMVIDTFGCVWYSDTVDVIVDQNPLFIVNVKNRYFFVDSTKADAMTCDSIQIQNLSADTIMISRTRLLRNIEFSIPQSQLSLSIAPREIQNLRVCYRPSELFEQRDTLVIGDYCQRVLFLVSAGTPNEYRSLTRCDVALRATTEQIRTRGLYVYPAYPNPAQTTVGLRVVVASQNHLERAELFDLMGQQRHIRTVTTMVGGNSTTKDSVFDLVLDTSDLESGVYNLQILTAYGIESRLILIQR